LRLCQGHLLRIQMNRGGSQKVLSLLLLEIFLDAAGGPQAQTNHRTGGKT
jgi:hypothetical protein